MAGKLLVINGSYRREGNTYRCLVKESQRLCAEHGLEAKHVYLQDDLVACRNCGPNRCGIGCHFIDQFQLILEELKDAEYVLFGSPVYLDFPSPKLLALLSRLNCMAESTEREFFQGKKAFFLATAYCSGTKAVIHTLMAACEMLGFTIEGRSSKEWVEIWKDKKIRGGMRPGDSCYLD